jgi:hypothetical protein
MTSDVGGTGDEPVQRRRFITDAARKIPTVGGSLTDVQVLAGFAPGDVEIRGGGGMRFAADAATLKSAKVPEKPILSRRPFRNPHSASFDFDPNSSFTNVAWSAHEDDAKVSWCHDYFR